MQLQFTMAYEIPELSRSALSKAGANAACNIPYVEKQKMERLPRKQLQFTADVGRFAPKASIDTDVALLMRESRSGSELLKRRLAAGGENYFMSSEVPALARSW